MKVLFSADRQFVCFVHGDGKEYAFLKKFPAFLKQGAYHALPAKINVVHNVVQRLRKSRCKLELSESVNEFLQQPFRLRSLPDEFEFHTQPLEFQRIALRYLYTVGSGGLLLAPGMGKSKVVLDYIYLRQFKKSLVICPAALLFVWEDEIRIHRPELSFYVVGSTEFEKEAAGIAGSDVVIINYNKAVSLCVELGAAGFDFMHLDEFLIKDNRTARTEAMTYLGRRIPYRCGGSGTLVNNSITDIFCPVRYLEPSLVGGNITNFNDRHLVKVAVDRNNPNGTKRVVGFKGVDEARAILESCCIVMGKDAWLDMPEKRFFDISVSLTEEQRDVYYSLQRNYIAKVGGQFIEVDNPLVMMSKLYQISNGFLYLPEKEDLASNDVSELLPEGDKVRRRKPKRQVHYFENAGKIRALENLLTEKLAGRRAIIWFNMDAEYEQIRQMLDRLGHRFLTVKGGEKNTGSRVREFNSNPEYQWLVCQAKSVNYGITVLGTTLDKLEDEGVEVWPGISPEVYTEVFYSMNFSLEVYLQQQDRVHRLGQKHACEYYRIFASTPVESRIRQAISDKMTIREDMLVDIAEKLRSAPEGGSNQELCQKQDSIL